jgi:hypothetical protein
VYPPGRYYPWKGREYLGSKGPMKIPETFLFGPRRAWRSFSDPKQVPKQKKAINTYPYFFPKKYKKTQNRQVFCSFTKDQLKKEKFKWFLPQLLVAKL